MVTDYFNQRPYKVAARREIEVLSHAYTKAIEWGWADRHPFKGKLALPKEEPRTRYVEDWEILEMMSLEPRQKAGSVRAVQSFIRVMLLTGLRRVDLLRIQVDSVQEQGFVAHVGKSRNQLTFLWTQELWTAVSLAKNSRPAENSVWLFCKADGGGYFNEANGRADGWDSMWGRFVDRALLETKIVKRFTEHDLRARAVAAPLLRRSPISLAAHRKERRAITSRRSSSEGPNIVTVSAIGLQISPISAKYLAEVPVKEFIPASSVLPIHQKRRKMRISLATPPWADRQQIRALYEMARAMSRRTGNLHVVDHIVPLHHSLVCGLHVPANMRVVPERINAEKHNRFDPAEQELGASSTPALNLYPATLVLKNRVTESHSDST
jgi:hypothetical protein